MADKEKSAELILRLYELRREEVMRKARDWFFAFTPNSVDEVYAAATGPNSAYYRMVSSYWDMACSFVNHGAIDEEMFNAANQEQNLVYAKLQPFVEAIRAKAGPQYMAHLEQVVMRHPNAKENLERLREMAKTIAAARASAAADSANA